MHLALATHAYMVAQDLSCRHVLRLHGGGHIRRPNVIRNDMGALLNLYLLVNFRLPRLVLIIVVLGVDS